MYPQQIKTMVPQQVGGPITYLPYQSSSGLDIGSILDSFMPLLMMVVMLAMIMPMMKGLTASSNT